MSWRAVTVALCVAVSGAAVVGCVDVDDDNDLDVDDGCDPYAVSLVSYDPGPGGGFGSARLPGIVLGAPDNDVDSGGGSVDDVVSLGDGGAIVVELGCAVADSDGVDFVVYENPFQIAGSSLINTEAGVVGVSVDGDVFVDFACVSADYADDGDNGCAGMAPGGDGFDLAALGVDNVRYVRVVDRFDDIDVDVDLGAKEGKAGFDFDAVRVVHAADEEG